MLALVALLRKVILSFFLNYSRHVFSKTKGVRIPEPITLQKIHTVEVL